MKDTVFIYTTMPTHIPDLKRRITEPLATVTSAALVKVPEEMEYQIDVCRATRGGLY
jgi:hypothetical protein